MKETTTRGEMDSGCPQGEVLSFFIGCVIVNENLVKHTRLGIPVVSYTDIITTIVPRGYNRTHLGDLTFIDCWSRGTSLAVNPTGTEIIVFTRK